MCKELINRKLNYFLKKYKILKASHSKDSENFIHDVN